MGILGSQASKKKTVQRRPKLDCDPEPKKVKPKQHPKRNGLKVAKARAGRGVPGESICCEIGHSRGFVFGRRTFPFDFATFLRSLETSIFFYPENSLNVPRNGTKLAEEWP